MKCWLLLLALLSCNAFADVTIRKNGVTALGDNHLSAQAVVKQGDIITVILPTGTASKGHWFVKQNTVNAKVKLIGMKTLGQDDVLKLRVIASQGQGTLFFGQHPRGEPDPVIVDSYYVDYVIGLNTSESVKILAAMKKARDITGDADINLVVNPSTR